MRMDQRMYLMMTMSDETKIMSEFAGETKKEHLNALELHTSRDAGKKVHTTDGTTVSRCFSREASHDMPFKILSKLISIFNAFHSDYYSLGFGSRPTRRGS